jgi:hypothetical protein
VGNLLRPIAADPHAAPSTRTASRAINKHKSADCSLTGFHVREAFLGQHLTVEEATGKFFRDAGIARYGKPEGIAELIAFLVSPGARWMTGSTLRMDGGEVKSIIAPTGELMSAQFRKSCQSAQRDALQSDCHPSDLISLRMARRE